jgi:hypothetical protein
MPRTTALLSEGQSVLASYGMRSTAARVLHAKRLSAKNAVALKCVAAAFSTRLMV